MDSKKIGAFIALNRKKKGLTQEQLGEKLGVSNKTISRWENGNYMPDLSMLVPLSEELGISLNELLAGEEIKREEEASYLESNLISTINYSVKKMKKEHIKISALLIGAGIFICICSFNLFAPESSFGEISSIFGLLLIASGIFRELKISSIWKRGLICAGFFVIALALFMVVDFIGVSEWKRPPRYRYMTITSMSETKIIEYRNLFYHVFRIHADTPNEYYVIDTKKEYDMDTVPISPFNREKSGIEQIKKYQSLYVGNNSNTGNLIGALPLSEYGYVFEIDSKNCGLTIDYHFTDWYANENLYTEKGLLYNAVSVFGLIDNLEYIRFNFSGSSYFITREKIEQSYPDYEKVFFDQTVDEEHFNQSVEKKMNDEEFVASIFSVFEKI